MREQQSPRSLSRAAIDAARAMLGLGRQFLKLGQDLSAEAIARRQHTMDHHQHKLTLREASLDLRRAIWRAIRDTSNNSTTAARWTPEAQRELAERLAAEELRMRNMDPSPYRVEMGTSAVRPWWQRVEIVERSAIDRLGDLVDA